MKFRFIKLIIILQKKIYPVVVNCFDFAFRHDFRAGTRKRKPQPHQRMEAKGDSKKLSFSFFS